MVFQNYALYPHMTVADNMAFALKMAKVSPDERKKRVAEAAKILGLEEFLERAEGAVRWPAPALSPWAARSCATRRCSAWTSRCRTWTPRCGCTRTDIAKLQADLGVTTSTSPTTRSSYDDGRPGGGHEAR